MFYTLNLHHCWAEIDIMHNKKLILLLINVGQNNNNIIITVKIIYVSKLNSPVGSNLIMKATIFKYAEETLINLLILFSRNFYCTLLFLNKIDVRSKLYRFQHHNSVRIHQI